MFDLNIYVLFDIVLLFEIESRIPTASGELGPSWSLLTSSHQEDRQTGNKSKFFDDFTLNNSNRSQNQWPSTNTHSNQPDNDNNNFPIRQSYYSNERSYPQQQYRSQNGYMQNQQQRYYNNQRRTNPNNYQRRTGAGGYHRETFHDNGNNYDDDFDFETNNRKFNKIASEDEFKQQTETIPQPIQPMSSSTTEYEPIYDKKKSFFDNITHEDTSDVPIPMYNRSRNQDTFGNDRNQYQRNRGGAIGGHRRSNNYNNNNNNNYRQQQQQGNENFYYRQNNNNGYHYRH